MKKVFLSLVAIMAMTLVSCDKSNFNFATKEGAVQVQKHIVNKFGDNEVYYLKVMGKNELSSELAFISLKYVDAGKSYKQSLAAGKVTDAEVETAFGYKEGKDGKVKVSELDFSVIPVKFEEAVKYITENTDEYENFQLYDWTFDIVKDNKVTASFVVNATKKDEGTKMEGRYEVTNFYTFNFEMNADGTIEYKE